MKDENHTIKKGETQKTENSRKDGKDNDKDDDEEKEFNWFDDTAEFGFEDAEESTKRINITHIISKGILPFSISVIGIAFVSILILNFIPHKMRTIYGLCLKHICIILIILLFLLVLSKLAMHGAYILIRDHITENSLMHNKDIKLKFVFAVWFFEMIPVGIHLNRYIPWARTVIDRVFICGFLSVLVLMCKSILVELFRKHFLLSSLKEKAKDIEIQHRIIEALRKYCYGEEDDESETRLAECFLVDFIDDDSNSNQNQGMNFIKGDADKVIGDLVTKSIFTKAYLTQHEILCLARDLFTKCSKNQKYITFNDFCNIFPNAQTAVQAFLYFDSTNDKKLSKKEVRDTLGTFYYNRKNIQTTFNSLNNFVHVLDNLALVVTILPLILVFFIVFRFSIKEIVAFSLSSALLLNFFVSTIAKDFCLNASFILTHPFDVGDDIIIDGKGYTIYSISLYKTEVLGIDGGKLSFLNKVLWMKTIINMTRAPQKLIHVSFELDQNVDKDLFKALKKNILSYLRLKSKTFYEAFTIQSESEAVCNIEKNKCVLIVRCKSVGNKMSKLELKIELVNHLKDTLKKLKAL